MSLVELADESESWRHRHWSRWRKLEPPLCSSCRSACSARTRTGFAIFGSSRASWNKLRCSLCDLKVVSVRYRTVWSGISSYCVPAYPRTPAVLYLVHHWYLSRFVCACVYRLSACRPWSRRVQRVKAVIRSRHQHLDVSWCAWAVWSVSLASGRSTSETASSLCRSVDKISSSRSDTAVAFSTSVGDNTVSMQEKNLCQCYFLNNRSLKHWPILILFSKLDIDRRL